MVVLLLFWDSGSLLPETLRRHFLRAVAGAAFFVPVSAATSASCRGTSQQNIAFQMFLHLQTLRRLLSRPVAAGVSFSLKDVAASQCVCSRGADNLSISLIFFLGSDFCSPCYRWFYGHCRMNHGCAVRMETVQVHVASSLSVDLTWWPRRTTPTAPDLLPSYQSEASQSTTIVTKHSAATAGQTPVRDGRTFSS